MHKFFHSLFVAVLMIGSTALAAGAANDMGIIRVPVASQIQVRVTANSAELQNLAQVAFSSHGLYKLVSSGQAYDLKFTGGGNQVRVDITRSGAAPFSQTVSGTSARNALLRAADIAVERTNGLTPSLKGFFTAKLAFISQSTGKSEVYVSDLFGGEMLRVTHDGAHALSPRWSANGSRVIYTSYVGGAPDIYLLDPVSAQKNSFARYQGTNTGARFSPNGQLVAMVCGKGSPQIYTCDPQGRGAVARTRGDAVKSSPCWSPDGSQILFTMDPGPQLYVMPASGGTAQRFVSGGPTYMAEPDWSRANRNKVVCTVKEGGVFKIAVVDVSTRQAKVVSKAPYDAVEASWLADGRHVICTMRDARSSVLAILDTETGNSFRVSTVAQSMQAGVWMP